MCKALEAAFKIILKNEHALSPEKRIDLDRLCLATSLSDSCSPGYGVLLCFALLALH